MAMPLLLSISYLVVQRLQRQTHSAATIRWYVHTRDLRQLSGLVSNGLLCVIINARAVKMSFFSFHRRRPRPFLHVVRNRRLSFCRRGWTLCHLDSPAAAAAAAALPKYVM
jgi:hypothetical protein